jgi:CubicO group peptidase (beta-lactamase class C family)
MPTDKPAPVTPHPTVLRPTATQLPPTPIPASGVQGWRTSSPEEQGMDAGRLNEMMTYIDTQAINLHSVLVIRHGVIVAERYYGSFDQYSRREVYSVTKSFVSTLIGITLDRGLLGSIDQPVLGLFPDRAFENVDDRKWAMTVRNLLTMTPGLSWEESDATYAQLYASPDWLKYILDLPMEFQPGSQFEYDSGASHVLSAIIRQVSGMNTTDFARANLFGPLGITDFQWSADASGLPIGGWGLQLTPREMAKLGFLFLHRGVWNGQQIVSSDWVNAATKMQVSADNTLGYGYQWWINTSDGAYMALGRYGQAVYVRNDLDLVVVMTAEEDNHDRVLSLIGAFILPACSQ